MRSWRRRIVSDPNAREIQKQIEERKSQQEKRQKLDGDYLDEDEIRKEIDAHLALSYPPPSSSSSSSYALGTKLRGRPKVAFELEVSLFSCYAERL